MLGILNLTHQGLYAFGEVWVLRKIIKKNENENFHTAIYANV